MTPSVPASDEPTRSTGERFDLAGHLAFLELADADRRRLQAIAPLLESCAAQFVEVFYHHLFSFDQTAKFLHDPRLVERLKTKQQDHFTSMLRAQWDQEYVARRQRVGDAHAQIGINPQMLLGAYIQYLQFGLRELGKTRDIERDYVESVISLLKAIFLDLELTLDAYFAQATQNLRQALDLVFHANTELRQFAQLTSHDLKTPLATVANLCDEAIDEFGGQMPAEAQKLIEQARNRAFRMSRTIDELLSSTGTIQAGDQEKVSSARAINEAVEAVRPLLDQTEIQLKLAPDLPDVSGDPIRLREAFYNLLTNAIKFTDPQSGRIAIDVETRDEDCIFCVSDNGCGIPREELSRVFVPFRRLPGHERIPGSGLGLYFTKSIVEHCGGKIWAESMPGEGSRFFIQLRRWLPPQSAADTRDG